MTLMDFSLIIIATDSLNSCVCAHLYHYPVTKPDGNITWEGISR